MEDFLLAERLTGNAGLAAIGNGLAGPREIEALLHQGIRAGVVVLPPLVDTAVAGVARAVDHAVFQRRLIGVHVVTDHHPVAGFGMFEKEEKAFVGQ